MSEVYRETQNSTLESIPNKSLTLKELGERESIPSLISIPGPNLRTQWSILEASVKSQLLVETTPGGEGEAKLVQNATVQLAISLFIDNVPQAITIVPFTFKTNHEKFRIEQKTFILELFSSAIVPQGSSLSLSFKAILAKAGNNGEVKYLIVMENANFILRYNQRYPILRR